MKAYYNEIDPFAAQWLRNLIAAGHIAPGDVDTRSIVDVSADDLKGYRQVHLFAGLGGWSYALRLAGWDDARPCWTGSPPCQPWSAIGKRKGFNDDRHLWPEEYRLISQRAPDCVFGEQVASVDGLEWFTRVYADLENAGYTVGVVDYCAAGVAAPHIRQRIYWVGDAERARLEGHAGHGAESRPPQKTRPNATTSSGGAWSQFDALDCADGWRRVQPGTFPLANGIPARVGRLRAYGNAIVSQVAARFIRAYMEYTL